MRRRVPATPAATVTVVATLLLWAASPPSYGATDSNAPKATAKSAAAESQATPAATGAGSKRPSRFGAIEQGPFDESTQVQGKIDVDLQGVWLLVTNAEVSPGKFKTFPQLIKITKGKDGPEFHLLDVRLPEEVEQSLKDAQLAKWQPSADMRTSLAAHWSQLPAAKEKTINDFLFAKVEYVVASPEHYDVLGQRSQAINKVLEGSKFAMRITENYKPRELPPGTQVAQLAQRITVYGVKKAEKDVLSGDHALGFVAIGPVPIPLEFPGSFVMYRLAPL